MLNSLATDSTIPSKPTSTLIFPQTQTPQQLLANLESQAALKETLQGIQELLTANVAKGMGEGEGKELGWP